MEIRVSPIGRVGIASRAVIESLFRFRARFIGTLAVVLLVIALYTLFAPRHYESEMSIMVGDERTLPETKTGQANTSAASVITGADRVDAAVETLRSHEVADQVVTSLWKSPIKEQQPEAGSYTHEQAVRQLSGNLGVEPLRNSNIVHATYIARSPGVATETLRTLLQTFLKRQNNLQNKATTANVVAAEKERYHSELENAQKELAAYQQHSHIVSVSDNEAALEKQIIELKQQIRETDLQINELSERLAIGDRELQRLTQRQLTQQKSVPNILAMEQLSTMLATYRNQKTALLTKYQPTDRLVQEVDQQIVNTSEALHSAAEMQSSEKTTDVNPLWQQITSVMSQNTLDRSAAQVRRRSQSIQLEELNASLSAIENSTVDFNKLQARVGELQETYQLYTRKWNEEQMTKSLNQQELTDFSIVEQPTFSTIPSSPSPVFILFALFAFAPGLALVAVFFSELKRDTIASPSELQSISRISVLAMLPYIHADYLRSKLKSDLKDQASKQERPKTAWMSSFFDGLRLLSRFPVQATASMFMGSASPGPTNRGPTAHASRPINLTHGLSP